MSELQTLLWRFVRAGNAAAEIILGEPPSEIKRGDERGDDGSTDVDPWYPSTEDEDTDAMAGEIACIPPVLGRDQVVEAARVAVEENPANALPQYAMAVLAAPLDPMQIAVMTSKYWGPKSRVLTVSFTESTSDALRRRILSHMNAWSGSRGGGISFKLTSSGGHVRISRETAGYWSYLGTDIKVIASSRPTMSLQAFTMSTPESEYRRVVRHETGHTLGFPHEHMRRELIARIDRARAYNFFLTEYGWNQQTVDAQVLTPLDNRSLMRTPPDEDSIMCYQLPGSITVDGKPIRGGLDINRTDYAFAAKIYPKPAGARALKATDAADDCADLPATVSSAPLMSAVEIARSYAGTAAPTDGVGAAATRVPGY
jgi:hypothetical protein